MLLLTLHTVKDLLTNEQKQFLTQEFTRLLVQTGGAGNSEVGHMVWIQIDEAEPNHFKDDRLHPILGKIAGFVHHQKVN